MAYLTPDTNKRRIAALGAVGAVHGVMAVAILTGFAGGMIQKITHQALPAWTYMPPPKPTMTPQPVPSTSPRPHDTVPQQTLPTDPITTPYIDIDTGPLAPIDTGLGGGTLAPLPTDPPKPTFTPRAAQPLGSPGKWVSDADYPTAALRRGQQGAASFEVGIGPDGRVRDCRITRSSGSAELDAATCGRVSERAQFTPARDEHGDMVAGRYAGVIRWRIPE